MQYIFLGHYMKVRATLLVLLLYFSQFASAQSLTVYTENLPPYHYFDKQNKLTGYGIELVKAMFQQANIAAPIKVVPWVRGYNYALNKKNVMLFSMVRTQEREALFHWIGEIDQLNYFLYQLAARKDIAVDDFEQAKLYRIGVGASSFEYSKLKQLGVPSITTSSSYLQLIEMLKANRFDLLFSSKEAFKGLLNETNNAPALFKSALHVTQFDQRMFIAMSKSSDPLLVAKMRQAYQALVQQGARDRLKALWLN